MNAGLGREQRRRLGFTLAATLILPVMVAGSRVLFTWDVLPRATRGGGIDLPGDASGPWFLVLPGMCGLLVLLSEGAPRAARACLLAFLGALPLAVLFWPEVARAPSPEAAHYLATSLGVLLLFATMHGGIYAMQAVPEARGGALVAGGSGLVLLVWLLLPVHPWVTDVGHGSILDLGGHVVSAGVPGLALFGLLLLLLLAALACALLLFPGRRPRVARMLVLAAFWAAVVTTVLMPLLGTQDVPASALVATLAFALRFYGSVALFSYGVADMLLLRAGGPPPHAGIVATFD